MSRHILLTGATGAIGLPLAARLLADPATETLRAVIRNPADEEKLRAVLEEPDRLKVVIGDITRVTTELGHQTGVTEIIHGAAFTKFRDTDGEWDAVNVHGTREMLAWREAHCPNARFIHMSTLCAAGKTVGCITEAPLEKPEFVNGYEQSKWEAEQLVQSAGGPRVVVRLATAIGSESDGSLGRVGAFHHVLRWVYRGLLPLIPGDESTRIDLISTEYATEGIARLIGTPHDSGLAFFNFSRGGEAIPLGELIGVCAARFGGESEAWKRGQVDAPVLASIPAFEEFRRSVLASQDMLFTRVLESVDSFLPELFFPKEFATGATEALFGGRLPLRDWKPLMNRVLDFSLRSDFGRTL